MRRLILWWKIVRINREIPPLIRRYGVECYVTSFGAYYIYPDCLVFAIRVNTDKECEQLNANDELKRELRGLLDKYNWPVEGRDGVGFSIDSQETVSRDWDGNWFQYYK